MLPKLLQISELGLGYRSRPFNSPYYNLARMFPFRVIPKVQLVLVSTRTRISHSVDRWDGFAGPFTPFLRLHALQVVYSSLQEMERT